MRKTINSLFGAIALLTFALFTACNDKESDLGINLVDGETSYGDVKDVKLSELESGVSLIANLEGFEPGINDILDEIAVCNHRLVTSSKEIRNTKRQPSEIYTTK